MRHEGNHIIINEELQSKIAYLLSIDINKRPFVASAKYKSDAPFILEQIICQSKAKVKASLWHQSNCLYTTKSIEQATHERVASFKAHLIKKLSAQKEMTSLTGGLGIDDYFFSKQFEKVTTIDNDDFLNEIVRYNLIQLKCSNIERLSTTAEQYLASSPCIAQCIYIDPDRRASPNSTNKKVVEFSPDVSQIIPGLLDLNNTIFIKLSGVTDISWIKYNFPFLQKIIVISLKDEVKEILIYLNPNLASTANISIVNIDNSVLELEEHEIIKLKKELNQDKGNYLFKPLSAIIKSNILRDNEISVSENVPYYQTDNIELSELGSLYKIEDELTLGLKDLKKHLAKVNINSSSIVTRNCKLNSSELKKYLKIKENPTRQIFVFGVGKVNRVFITNRL